MGMFDEITKVHWRCNGCGANFDEPELCYYCNASHCPVCKRTNTLMNVTEFRASVNRSVETKSQMKASKRRGSTKPKKASKDRIAELMRITE